MLISLLILSVLTVLATAATIQDPLRIGAWNIQRLGDTKMGKPEVVDILVKVMRRYDIIVALEIVDKDGSVPPDLLNALNKDQSPENTYKLTISERLGRTTYKEQYGYYWKPSRVDVLDTFQYNDVELDNFQFEPFVVIFKQVMETSLEKFALIPIHTKPSDAVKEIDSLVDVYDSLRTNKNIDDALILGDFNAGCDYVTGNDYQSIRLWTDPRFSWLISDHIDTTVKGTTCPYDRIVVVGDKLKSAVYPYSSNPYYFDEELGIKNNDLVEDVSDHYPVEVLLPGAVSSGLSKTSLPSTAISVKFEATFSSITQLSKSMQLISCSDQLVSADWTQPSLTTTMEFLDTLQRDYSYLITNEVVTVLQYKLSHGGLEDITLYGKATNPKDLLISILCFKYKHYCTLSISASTSIN